MKILYVDQTGQLGGGEIALLPWLRHTHDSANVVLFEEGPFRAQLEQCGVAVEVLALSRLKHVRRESGSRDLLSTLPALLALRRRLAQRTSAYDVVWANSQKAFFVAALARQHKQPLIWHLRDILTGEHFSPTLRRLAVFFGNRFATCVIANSQATADSFIAAGGHREKVVVVHDGVSAEPFDRPAATDPSAIAELRRQLAPEASIVIGLFGRLTPWKGQHILLEAISQLPRVHAVLVGDALFGEQPYADRLRHRAAQPDLAGRVHFAGFRDDVPALMRSMDIIVHTSTAPEPFGLVLVEGMLAQRPIIATAAGGALEIVTSGESGLLVTPGSVEQLRSAIEELCANPARASQLAAAGRRRAEQHFSLHALFHGLSSVLATVTANSRRTPSA